MTQIINYSQFESTASKEQLIVALRRSQAETDRLKTEKEQLASQVSTQRELLAEANSELFWVQSLMGNKNLNGNQKSVLYACYQLTSQGKMRDDGLVRMFRGAIAARAGVSLHTATNTVKKLSESGNLRRNVSFNTDGQAGLEKELYVAIPDVVLQNPGGIVVRTEEKRGGKIDRVIETCKHCGSDHIYTVCGGCATVLQEDDIIEVLESTIEYQAQLEAEDRLEDEYPLPQLEALAAEGSIKPDRDCMRCGKRYWLPAYTDGRWVILCGSEECHPLLLESHGLDVTLGPAMRGI